MGASGPTRFHESGKPYLDTSNYEVSSTNRLLARSTQALATPDLQLPVSMSALKAPSAEFAYSISKEFNGTTILITGASGYLGSLLVEQLLRTTDVGRIYVLMRSKAGCTAQERLTRLLYSGLFHLVRDTPTLLDKVHLLQGDLDSDDLGLSQDDLHKVLSEVQIVLHCAASIELEADIQHTLRSNYVGTRRLLSLATHMQHLRCFLHLSTAFVNINQPRSSIVEERVYPLKMGTEVIHHEGIVEELMCLEPEVANVRAQMLMDRWHFPNTYTFGKYMSEQQVCGFYRQCLPVGIVRPALVGGIAGAPYPGYCGNLAGPVGVALAIAIGMFDHLDSVAMVPKHVWDAVPSDVVMSAILATAAAMCAGLDAVGGCIHPTANSTADPFIVHAGTSSTFPISFAEAQHVGIAIMKDNPPPFRLPGGRLFKVPVDYRPDDKAVQWRKTMVAWKVWVCVQALTLFGQHKAARRLKYGHKGWVVHNSAKTDKDLIFDARNLKTLAACLDPTDAASGHFTITWTLKSSKGGWPRHIATCLAGVYRQVFGITELRGVAHDFRFIPHKSPAGRAAAAPAPPAAAAAAEEEAMGQQQLRPGTESAAGQDAPVWCDGDTPHKAAGYLTRSQQPKPQCRPDHDDISAARDTNPRR